MRNRRSLLVMMSATAAARIEAVLVAATPDWLTAFAASL